MADFRQLAGQTIFDQTGFFQSHLQNMVAVGNFQMAQLKISTFDALRQCSIPETSEVFVGTRFRDCVKSQAATILSVSKQNR